MGKTRSKYEIVYVGENRIFLSDLNGLVSVTNDAENVFNEVYREGHRVFYKDSLGCWDEMKMVNGSIQFLPISELEFPFKR